MTNTKLKFSSQKVYFDEGIASILGLDIPNEWHMPGCGSPSKTLTVKNVYEDNADTYGTITVGGKDYEVTLFKCDLIHLQQNEGKTSVRKGIFWYCQD